MTKLTDVERAIRSAALSAGTTPEAIQSTHPTPPTTIPLGYHDFTDRTVDNITHRAEALVDCIRSIGYGSVETRYLTTEGDLELSIHISIRGKKNSICGPDGRVE